MDTFVFFDGGLEASGHVGYQWIDVGQDYLYYDLGLTAGWGVFSFDVRWVGTDIDDADCSLTDTCEGGVVLSVSAELPG
ncbi:MAG: hypothetical protein HXY24_03865 [Rubrivivax sp.]|nr:hypothetical protein [Rubrivivax sp.]